MLYSIGLLLFSSYWKDLLVILQKVETKFSFKAFVLVILHTCTVYIVFFS